MLLPLPLESDRTTQKVYSSSYFRQHDFRDETLVGSVHFSLLNRRDVQAARLDSK